MNNNRLTIINDERGMAARVNRVRNELKQDGKASLLIINGSDGCDVAENNVFMNWLFKGNNGAKIKQDTFLDTSFEESIFLITQESFYCFINEKVFRPYFKSFLYINNRNIKLYTDEEVENDRDGFELRKASVFYNFVEQQNKIFLLNNVTDKKVFKKYVEEIPLVQTYALDGWLKRGWKWVFHNEEAG